MPMTAAQLAAGIAGVLAFTRASAAYDVDSASVMRSYANDVPLIGYQNALYGERVEAAGTNLLQRSQEFDNAYWTKTVVTVTPDTDVAPDGTTTADTVNDGDAAASGRLRRSLTISADSTYYAASLFVKKTGAPTTFPALNFTWTGGPGAGFVVLNTQTGATLKNANVFAGGAVDCGGWWRLWGIAQNNGSATALSCELRPAHAGSLTTTADVTQTGSQVAWGFDCKNDAWMSSYVPTTSAAVTRAAANALHTMAADLAGDFVALAKVRLSSAAVSGVYQPTLFELQGASSNERVRALVDPATQKIWVVSVIGGVNVGSVLLGSAVSPPAELKLAVRVRMGEIDASLGGAAPVRICSGRPAGLANFARGMQVTASASTFLNDLIRTAEISPYDITDAALQALTA